MPSPKKSNLRILLVEDDEDDALIFKEMIAEGFGRQKPAIEIAASREETLRLLKNSSFDLCLFDYRLGATNGISLLQEARESGFTGPVIMLTGQGDQEVAVEAMKAGAVDYLVKNKLSAETLSHAIHYAVQLAREAERRNQAEALLKKSHEELTRKNEELEISLKKLRATQNQLLQTEKLAGIGRLAAGVCHEILNPLNIISGHAQALLLERGRDKALVDDMNSVIEEIHRIEKIIGSLLKFSRKGRTEFQSVDINAEIESVLDIVEREMNLANIFVVRDYQSDLPPIFVDADRLRQVYLNIINNAKYAMLQRGGTLTVTTKLVHKERRRRRTDFAQETARDSGYPFITIRFKDTGTGIKPEDLDKLFEPFFTTKPEDKGTGLGLSVCYNIVEKHSGQLSVESEYGHGATFIIDLPLESEAATIHEPEEGEEEEETGFDR